ncbi:hypothetical protein LCGC14_1788880, partial [marine sediment metagenome]
ADTLVKDIALSIGASVFIEKPFDIEDLVEKIEFVLSL